jgi:hypothetical protein
MATRADICARTMRRRHHEQLQCQSTCYCSPSHRKWTPAALPRISSLKAACVAAGECRASGAPGCCGIDVPALPGWADVSLPALRAWVRFAVHCRLSHRLFRLGLSLAGRPYEPGDLVFFRFWDSRADSLDPEERNTNRYHHCS